MATQTKHFEELPELYLETIKSNAYYQGAAGTIVTAVIRAAGCGGDPDGPDLIRAAAKLTRDGMGFADTCIGQIDQDCLHDRRDWHRIDSFWDRCEASNLDWPPEEEAQEAVWIDSQLRGASADLLHAYANHRRADWCGDLHVAAIFFKAAAELVAEAFQIRESFH